MSAFHSQSASVYYRLASILIVLPILLQNGNHFDIMASMVCLWCPTSLDKSRHTSCILTLDLYWSSHFHNTIVVAESFAGGLRPPKHSTLAMMRLIRNYCYQTLWYCYQTFSSHNYMCSDPCFACWKEERIWHYIKRSSPHERPNGSLESRCLWLSYTEVLGNTEKNVHFRGMTFRLGLYMLRPTTVISVFSDEKRVCAVVRNALESLSCAALMW